MKGKATRGLLLLSVVLGAACADQKRSHEAAKAIDDKIEAQLIYGEDNRLENYQASEALKTLAASTVALVQSSSLVADSQGYNLLGSTYGDQYNLCSSEPYREQTSGAFCSGSLVGPDLVMTAGHCIRSVSDCQSVRFVFDFAVKSPGVEKKRFSQDEVYACKEIIAREEVGTGADYAIIRLDRKVSSKSVLKVRRSGVVSVGDPLVVIGHPAGIPQKIAGGATVRSIASAHFVANLDTYGGNSGSAVFNANTKEIEGILVRGDQDFTWSGSCTVSNRIGMNAGRGEDVTRIDQVVRFIPDTSEGGGGGSGTQPEPPQTFQASANLAIPDYPRSGVTSSLYVSAAVSGRKVQVQIDLDHTYRGDLVVELIGPSGRTIQLHNRSGGSLDNLQGTYGVDLASVHPLAVFHQEKAGTWKLKVTDRASVDVGVLKQWSLILSR